MRWRLTSTVTRTQSRVTSSCLIRINWNTRTAIYIYKHMCVQYLKVVFASSEMILTVVMDERTHLTYEKRLQWR